MDVVIRPARADEVREVLALWRQAGAIPSVTDDAESVRALIRRDPGSLLLAEVDGRAVGTLVVTWDGWRGHLYRLVVSPDVRRRGIASRLVHEAERRLRAAGAKKVTAIVVAEHDHAVGFWRAVGYEHDENVRRYVRIVGA